ncbi:MAG TPA: pyridoxamine 5'-phosphate oxidase [Bacteroidales bacterium]|nr:pyridoxamine 5'-phosphate oxidase [Bacteroidales bacterium]
MAGNKHLSEKNVEKDPFLQFEKWYALRLAAVKENPNAFALATSSRHGDVSLRTVLLKDYGPGGFVFFTNFSSRKGNQLAENNKAAMLFYWPELHRQVRIEGRVQKLTSEESCHYFATRPRESRIGAWASEQSAAIPDRQYLLDRYNHYRDEFNGQNIPLPPDWGGFRLAALMFEFWQEGKYRLHDRIVYHPGPAGWRTSRLAP